MLQAVNSKLSQLYRIEELKMMISRANGRFDGMTLSAGISRVGSISNISELYTQARRALEHKFYAGAGSVTLYENLHSGGQTRTPSRQAMEQLDRAMSDLDQNAALKLIGDEYEAIRSDGAYARSR